MGRCLLALPGMQVVSVPCAVPIVLGYGVKPEDADRTRPTTGREAAGLLSPPGMGVVQWWISYFKTVWCCLARAGCEFDSPQPRFYVPGHNDTALDSTACPVCWQCMPCTDQ